MSRDDHADLARRLFSAYNAREFDPASLLLTDDLELEVVPTGERLRGRTGYLQHVRGWAAALPDSRLDVLSLDVGERAVVAELRLTGTHTGTLVGSAGQVPPTGREVEIVFCEMLAIEDGRVRGWRTYFDTGTLLRQMGLLPNSPLHAPDRRAALELYAEVEGSVQQGNRTVVLRFLEEVINGKDLDLATELCVPNLIWHGGTMGEIRDLRGYILLMTSFFAAFPDLRLEVQETLAEGDRVMVRTTLRGTHQGDFQGVPPTSRHVTVQGLSLYRVVNGRIVEEWWQQDLLDLMRQLDAVPAMVRLAKA